MTARIYKNSSPLLSGINMFSAPSTLALIVLTHIIFIQDACANKNYYQLPNLNSNIIYNKYSTYDKISGVDLNIFIGSKSGISITIPLKRNKYPVSPRDAVMIAKRKVGGDVLKIRLIKERYIINILTKRGRLTLVYINARNGKILKIK